MPGHDGTGPCGTGPIGRRMGPCGRGQKSGRGRRIGRGHGFRAMNQEEQKEIKAMEKED